jgi:hypothetical protein
VLIRVNPWPHRSSIAFCLEDVALKKTVVAGADPVALDAYVAKAYWNLGITSLPYLRIAAQRGLGTYEFEKVRMSGRIGT